MLTNLEVGKQMDKWQLTWVDPRKLEAKCLWRRRWGENQSSSCFWHQMLLRPGACKVVQGEPVTWRLPEGFPDFLSPTPGRAWRIPLWENWQTYKQWLWLFLYEMARSCLFILEQSLSLCVVFHHVPSWTREETATFRESIGTDWFAHKKVSNWQRITVNDETCLDILSSPFTKILLKCKGIFFEEVSVWNFTLYFLRKPHPDASFSVCFFNTEWKLKEAFEGKWVTASFKILKICALSSFTVILPTLN